MNRKAANIISAQVILNPRSVLGLATGSTPIGVYSQLIDWYKKDDLDFSEVSTVNLDEYIGLAPHDPQSYAWFMHENFFKHINIQMHNVNLPDGMNLDIDRECQRYNNLIRQLGGIDLQLLGIGVNGHIGFNEPDKAFEKETHCVDLTQSTINTNSRFFNSIEQVPTRAYTMGIKSIMQAHKILLTASGSNKAGILRDALFGPITPTLPASILQMHPDFTVVADRDALQLVMQDQPDLFSASQRTAR